VLQVEKVSGGQLPFFDARDKETQAFNSNFTRSVVAADNDGEYPGCHAKGR
jgi:hypothetical protein